MILIACSLSSLAALKKNSAKPGLFMVSLEKCAPIAMYCMAALSSSSTWALILDMQGSTISAETAATVQAKKTATITDFISSVTGNQTGIMKAIIVFAILCGAAYAAEDSKTTLCFDDVVRGCKTTNKMSQSPISCSSKYGGIDYAQEYLQKYVNHHFIRSFEYLLMSTHYANYEKNRPGFEKLFRGLSDDTWKDAIELIQYITKRGGEMNFNLLSEEVQSEELNGNNFELYELNAVAKALDIQKRLAVESFAGHWEVSRKNMKFYDPEISYHLEEEFMPKHRDMIRKLAGYTTDLRSMLDGPDSSLALFLFDEYLQKQ
ncbi:hypothetical protein NQ318_021391 [Aromia moschata]|uniref:Ferritin n=1 Tax=Aromia moschata TaxID=1265417 RepID=A0AAV8ZEL3_9CUCU|nr:hypothetical protein NQ318_021391 [Aromia moschata]